MITNDYQRLPTITNDFHNSSSLQPCSAFLIIGGCAHAKGNQLPLLTWRILRWNTRTRHSIRTMLSEILDILTCHLIYYGERKTRHTCCPHGDGLLDEVVAELQLKTVWIVTKYTWDLHLYTFLEFDSIMGFINIHNLFHRPEFSLSHARQTILDTILDNV